MKKGCPTRRRDDIVHVCGSGCRPLGQVGLQAVPFLCFFLCFPCPTVVCHCQILPPKETIPSTSQCHTKAQRALSNRTRSSELHPLRLFRHPHPALARTKKSCHPVHPNQSDECLPFWCFIGLVLLAACYHRKAEQPLQKKRLRKTRDINTWAHLRV